VLDLSVQLLLVFLIDAAILVFLMWAHRAPRLARFRIHRGPGMQVPWKSRSRTMLVTAVLSLLAIFAGAYFGFGFFFRQGGASIGRIALESLGVLVLYDFIYYFAHRAMHHPAVLRHVHGVHHRARNPSALESFYQHPIELFVGISLLFIATWTVGPIHVESFALVFLVYSTFNILVHSGLDSGTWLLRPIDFLTRKHHAHHHDDPAKNFSSLTPLPDFLFGTL